MAAAFCFAGTPLVSVAAGLGKISVLSGLGQPFRAELEIQAVRSEMPGMTARLAPQALFQQAGVDYSSALLDLRFAVESRPNGKPVVKITSSKPINEPFLDFLVEINWPAGRLVRQYTFLLDPPEVAAKANGRAVSVVNAKVIEITPALPVEAAPAPATRRVAETLPAAAPKAPVSAEAETGSSHLVQRGETLRKIASEYLLDGVTLEQMLIGLYKKNPDAFVGSNVNRLKAGAILNLPDRAAVEAVSPSAARRMYLAQANDWNAYRQKLAGAAAQAMPGDRGDGQASAGRIAAKVEDRATPAESSKDQVRLSKTELAARAATSASASENDVARDNALKEAQIRLALLEKNVTDLQKLLEAKNEQLAELQRQNTSSKDEVKPLEPAAPLTKVPEQADSATVPRAAEALKPEPEASKVVEPAPADKPLEVVKPVQPPAPPVAATPLPQSPAPGYLDELLADPLPLAGGAGLLALLGGYLLYKRRRPSYPPDTNAAPGPSSLGPNSVFRMTGGQSVDTGNVPPQTGDFSQTGPGTIDTDEVDPVAEADVYMAYGRDAQAEEILIEALQKDPQRTAIHAKLLEIYANRKSLKQFETLASELYAQTSGVGVEWAKVAALGITLDPHNPLYSGAHTTLREDFDGDAALPADAQKSEATADAVDATDLPAAADDSLIDAPRPEPEFESGADIAPVKPEAPALARADDAPVVVDKVKSLDFDFQATDIQPERLTALEQVAESDFVTTVVQADSGALDFDLDGAAATTPVTVPEPLGKDQPAEESLDFDLAPAAHAGLPDSPADSASANLDAVTTESMTDTLVGHETPFDDEQNKGILPMAGDDESLDFDVKLSESVVLGQAMLPPGYDIGSINLDLSADLPVEHQSDSLPQAAVQEVMAASEMNVSPLEPVLPTPPEFSATQREEVSTKLDLAKAYEEMGDLEGARELLQEVTQEGPADLVDQAREILGRLGG